MKMKALEKLMTLVEAKEYFETHPQYRMPIEDDLKQHPGQIWDIVKDSPFFMQPPKDKNPGEDRAFVVRYLAIGDEPVTHDMHMLTKNKVLAVENSATNQLAAIFRGCPLLRGDNEIPGDFVINSREDKEKELLKLFPLGTIIESADGKNGGSEVFRGSGGELQPFSYLDDWDPSHYRVKED